MGIATIIEARVSRGDFNMTNAISYQIDADKVVTLTIDMPGQSANTYECRLS